MGPLTKAQENYLRAILCLAEGGAGVRLTDLAVRMQVTKASTCGAVTKLEQAGYLRRDESRLIYLTPKGEAEAYRIADTFTVIRFFLTQTLKIDADTALRDAGRLEHDVSAETVDALRIMMA